MFSQLELWLAATIRQQLVEMGEAGDMEAPQHTARYVHYILYRRIHLDALMQVHHPAAHDLRVPVRPAAEHVQDPGS